MARTAKIIRWFNKEDITLYYRGKKVYRSNDVHDVQRFEERFMSLINDPEFHENMRKELMAIDETPAETVEDDTPVDHPSTISLTKKSLDLFVAYAEDADNWSGSPLVGGNVGGSKEDRGNLTQLKKAGLITTDYDRQDDCTWINFTKMGREYASALGIFIPNYRF
jgi:hypothetical protein